MISAWNMIGLIVWIMIIVYFGFMIISIRKRNQQALLQQNNNLLKRNLMISIFQGIVLLASITAMVFLSIRGNESSKNVSFTRSYKPIVLDTNGHKSYYVNVYNSKRNQADQYYTYLTKGEHYKVASEHAIIITGKTSFSMPMGSYRTDDNQMKILDQKYQKAWIESITTKYKPNFWNGLGMRVGRQASHYVIIRVPDQSFVYYR